MKTVVLVASIKPQKYSYLAVQRLLENDHEVVPLGYSKGNIEGVDIVLDFPMIPDVHTITLYLNPIRQVEHYDYILSLKPKRIIFNPGTENYKFREMAEAKGIKTIYACTLVMLSIGNY